MFGGALGLIFSTRYHDDDPWLGQRPDRKRYEQIKEEMDERLLIGYEPPLNRKDHREVHPWIQYGIRHGLPAMLGTAIVGWFLYDYTGAMKLSNKHLENQSQQLALMRQEMTAEHSVIRDRLDRTDRMQVTMVAVIMAGCVNASRNYEERQRCLQAGR